MSDKLILSVDDVRALHMRTVINRTEEILGDRRWKMYDEGVYSAKLNALDKNSPHAAQTIEEVHWWFHNIMEYVSQWDREHPVNIGWQG